MQIRTLLRQAVIELKQAGIDSPRLDAELLMMHVTHLSKVQLITHDTDELGALETTVFQALLQERREGHPIAHLLGEREFWDLTLKVTPDTLIPRPDTEVLVEKALTLIDCHHLQRVLDLGTGTGAIILALKHVRPYLQVSAVDFSPAALQVAMENARHYGLAVDFYLGSWFEALSNPVILNHNGQVVAQSKEAVLSKKEAAYKGALSKKHKVVSHVLASEVANSQAHSLFNTDGKGVTQDAAHAYVGEGCQVSEDAHSFDGTHSSKAAHLLDVAHVASQTLSGEQHNLSCPTDLLSESTNAAQAHEHVAHSSKSNMQGCLCDMQGCIDEHMCFDMIVSNPPYIEDGDPHLSQGDLRFEPLTALTSGPDGLDDIRQIILQSRRHLNEGGYLLLEHGYNQGAAVRNLLQQAEFENIETIKDYGMNERVTLGRYYRHHGSRLLTN